MKIFVFGLLVSALSLASEPELLPTSYEKITAIGLENCASQLVHRVLSQSQYFAEERVDLSRSRITLAVSTPLNWYLRMFYFETDNYEGWAYLSQTSRQLIQNSRWVTEYTCSLTRTVWGGPNFQLLDPATHEILAAGYTPR